MACGTNREAREGIAAKGVRKPLRVVDLRDAVQDDATESGNMQSVRQTPLILSENPCDLDRPVELDMPPPRTVG